MKKILATLLMVAGLGSMPALAQANQTQTPDIPVTTAKAESEVTVYVRGPFYTYSAAANYADWLEWEYGFFTEVVYRSGYYYVLYA